MSTLIGGKGYDGDGFRAESPIAARSPSYQTYPTAWPSIASANAATKAATLS